MNGAALLRPTIAGDAQRVTGGPRQVVKPPCPALDHEGAGGRGFAFVCASCGALLANRYQLDLHVEGRPGHPRYHFVARVCPFHGAEAWAPGPHP